MDALSYPSAGAAAPNVGDRLSLGPSVPSSPTAPNTASCSPSRREHLPRCRSSLPWPQPRRSPRGTPPPLRRYTRTLSSPAPVRRRSPSFTPTLLAYPCARCALPAAVMAVRASLFPCASMGTTAPTPVAMGSTVAPVGLPPAWTAFQVARSSPPSIAQTPRPSTQLASPTSPPYPSSAPTQPPLMCLL